MNTLKIDKKLTDAEKILWVAKAQGDDTDRFFLMGVEYEADSKLLIATDGRRLHLSNVELDLPSGRYSVESTKNSVFLSKKSEDEAGQYPSWRRIMPDQKKHYLALKILIVILL